MHHHVYIPAKLLNEVFLSRNLFETALVLIAGLPVNRKTQTRTRNEYCNYNVCDQNIAALKLRCHSFFLNLFAYGFGYSLFSFKSRVIFSFRQREMHKVVKGIKLTKKRPGTAGVEF
eukprot:GHVL01028082.1.p1 GENE.GHVL01028082.1~~GHVL01028082.1.p1  ORF type:complete len:117 (-),score=1.56 GHVL01028082.1:319-669(-)